MDVCLRVLKESNKSSFDSYSVRNSVMISHIAFRDCRVHIFPTTFLEIALCLGHLARNAQSLQENSQSERAYYCSPIVNVRNESVKSGRRSLSYFSVAVFLV